MANTKSTNITNFNNNNNLMSLLQNNSIHDYPKSNSTLLSP